jgi:predicted AAA+ superfamily ATPase
MLQRKITKQIEEFYKDNPKKALMIIGARQVGKSYIIEQFAAAHYESVIKMDFIENPDYITLFEGAQGADEILLRLSALFGDRMIPGKTMIFFDEVQECKELITQIKYLVQDGKYSYILSGSLLGTVFKDIISAPVGYMDIVTMYPLDFEEFVLALGLSAVVLDSIKDAWNKREPVDAVVHERMMRLFRLYLVVGGMPAVVQHYLDTNNLQDVIREQQAIIRLYKRDIAKYDPANKLYIQEIFNLIPPELNAKNKRFVLKNLNEHFKFSRYENSFLWLKDAGVAIPVYNVEEPTFPLLLARSRNLFKLFQNDVGLLSCQYSEGIQLELIDGDTGINYGAVYENAVAQELRAHGYSPYYFNSKRQGELDFVIEREGQVIPIEVKSGKDYHTHRALNNVISCENYNISEAYVLCNSNLTVDGAVLYAPIYMMMFIQKEVIPSVVYKVDLSDINDMSSK